MGALRFVLALLAPSSPSSSTSFCPTRTRNTSSTSATCSSREVEASFVGLGLALAVSRSRWRHCKTVRWNGESGFGRALIVTLSLPPSFSFPSSFCFSFPFPTSSATSSPASSGKARTGTIDRAALPLAPRGVRSVFGVDREFKKRGGWGTRCALRGEMGLARGVLVNLVGLSDVDMLRVRCGDLGWTRAGVREVDGESV